ncbi:LITAF domain-containing protein-like [Mytilus edulis]|uniref:LITAF domain-containing protein-like n=1 Tax=Mytilus edulis TaxID=6550 RepID=UPI0039F047A4
MTEKGAPPPQYNPPPPAYPGQYNQQAGGYPAQPQPQYGYGGQQSSATVVVTGQPTVLIQQFREAPVRTQCPSCRADILTSTHYETGTMTWVVAGVLCFVGLWIGCCLIPFCIDGCKDVVHTCPSCRHSIGRFNRM